MDETDWEDRVSAAPEESAALLTAEIEVGSNELDGAVLAFLALALAGTGREREGLSVALAALTPHLPRYRRAVAAYAGLLAQPATGT